MPAKKRAAKKQAVKKLSAKIKVARKKTTIRSRKMEWTDEARAAFKAEIKDEIKAEIMAELPPAVEPDVEPIRPPDVEPESQPDSPTGLMSEREALRQDLRGVYGHEAQAEAQQRNAALPESERLTDREIFPENY